VADASSDTAYLQALVPVMRELGVECYAGVVLGPDPTSTAHSVEPELTPDERRMLAQRQEAQRLDRMRFGASGGPRPLGRDQR